MKIFEKSPPIIYRLVVTLVAIALLVAYTVLGWSSFSWISLLVALFAAALFVLPTNLLSNEINLLHVIVMGSMLLYGPVTIGWAILIGVFAGYLIRQLRPAWLPRSVGNSFPAYLEAGFAVGLQILPMLVSLVFFGSMEGITASLVSFSQAWRSGLVALLVFALSHGLLFLIDFRLRRSRLDNPFRRDLIFLILLEFVPIPFVFLAVSAYPTLGAWTTIFLGSLAVIVAAFTNNISNTRLALEHRVKELSTLNQISQVLQSTLNLESLLGTIHQQVTQLLKVDNFYVALYDDAQQRLWYPLAVKHGQRKSWPPRPIFPDRLTDRVIGDGRPILMTTATRPELERSGLPTSEESPTAWIGVPLITSERVIGCLAVFSIGEEAEFTASDQNLLTILSGQASVAIENALLYEQTHRRSAQLETLNRISTLITASLDQQEVLAQVCRSVAEVGGGQHSAIFLLDTEKSQVFLAYAHGLSEDFAQSNQSFSMTQSGRLRCLRTGLPVLSSALTVTPVELKYLDSLQHEGIKAYGDFPLSTPNGQIGFLSVYFDSLHTFLPEEVDLLQTFAAQAALAVQNARIYSHADMALARRVNQLEILEAVGRELSAAIHSERLFEIILNYAMDFTNSLWGELALLNQQTHILEVKAARGYSQERKTFSIRDGISGRAVSTQKAINIADVSTTSDFIDMTGGLARSTLCIPLIHEERVLGVLSLESDRQEAYSSNDQVFVSQLAVQAAVAVVNAELYSETQRRLREQSVLYLVGMQLVSGPELDKVLQTVVRAMEASLQTSSVGIYLWDRTEEAYFSRYSVQSAAQPSCGLPEKVIYADLEAVYPGLAKTGPLRITQRRGRELLGSCEDCQALVFPLIANKQRIGMVLIHVPKGQAVQDDELQLLRAVVAQVSISLQNALLFDDVTHGLDRLAAVLNSVNEGILMVETSGSIMLANQFVQMVTGLSKDDLSSRKLADLPDSALSSIGYSREEIETLVINLTQGQPVSSPKKTYKTSSKPERVLERTTSPVWGQGGRAIGWMIILHDVTEEQQIAQARELITETLVHDLRSPVSAVLSAIDVIDEALPEGQRDEISEQALRVAHSGATRVLGLIESLLDIAKMQSGQMDLNLTPVDLRSLIASVFGEFISQANEYGIILVNNVPETLPPACIDKSKVTRVVVNLLDNALKFTPAGGQVQIQAGIGPDQKIAVEISDTGPGIPDEYRQKIFERFTQIPGQRGRRRGSGLGLTFCRMAIEAHGGRIWVENRQAPGSGSIFTFTLPVMGDHVEKLSPASP